MRALFVEVGMRQVGLRLGLFFALALSASAPSLHPREAEKPQQAASATAQNATKAQQAPAQDAEKPQPPAAAQPPAQTQARTVTCTVDTSPKTLSAALADALHLYRTGKFDDAA